MPATGAVVMSAAKKQIFVIEDNDADAVLIEEALSTAVCLNCEVTRFIDGVEAMSVLSGREERLPDVILLDLNMPGSDGLDILRRIRNTPRLAHVRVGILTGSRASGDESRASIIGASRYVHKPLSYDEFVSGVRRAVEEMLEEGPCS